MSRSLLGRLIISMLVLEVALADIGPGHVTHASVASRVAVSGTAHVSAMPGIQAGSSQPTPTPTNSYSGSGQQHGPLRHNFNRMRAAASAAPAASGGIASMQPPALSLVLAPGASTTVPVQVSVPSALSKVDVLFIFDMTGSMGSVIDANKADANQIMNAILAQSPDTAFGAAYFDDYYFGNYTQPPQYSYYGEENLADGSSYDSDYSDCSSDTPWQIASDINTDVPAVQSAVDGIPDGCGGDYPEAQVRALWEATQPDSIHWRSGAKRIVVLLTDSPVHDPNFTPPGTYPDGTPYETRDYGWDPGRDGVIGTADDLRLTAAVAADVSAGITVIPVIMNYAEAWTQGEYQYVAQQTGGQVVLADPTSSSGENSIQSAIESSVGTSTGTIGDLKLTVSDSTYASWVSTSPSDFHNVSGGTTSTFQTTIAVPADTPPGLYSFYLSAAGDGSTIDTMPVVVTTGSPKSGQISSTYRPSDDGFGFQNKDSAATAQMFAQEYGVPVSFVSKILPQLVKDYLNVGSGGSCFGFAAASGINYLGLDQTSAGPYALPRSSPLNMQPDNSTIDQSIAFYQASQLGWQTMQLQSIDYSAQVGALLTQIEASISTGTQGTPVLVSIHGKDDGKNDGHALLAYKYTTGFNDPQHPGAPAVAVGVYDSNYPNGTDADSREIVFWQDKAAVWHWYYTLQDGFYIGPIKIVAPLTWSGPSGSDSMMEVNPVQQVTLPGTLPMVGGSATGSAIGYDGTGSLTISDALDQEATVDSSGQVSGDLPGTVPLIPLDALAVPSTGLLYVPETSAYTITESPTITGSMSFGILGTDGEVDLAETGDNSGQPLTATVGASAHNVQFGSGSNVGDTAVTLEQVINGDLRTLTVSGLSTSADQAQDVQVSPDGQSISLLGGPTGASYSLAATQVDATGVASSTIVSDLSAPPGVTETVEPNWTAPNSPITITDVDSFGNVTQNTISPDAPLIVGDGQAAAPGDSVDITATDGTFAAGEALTIEADGLIAPETGLATLSGGASLTVTVPATATTGTYVLTVRGIADSVHASGVLSVIAPTVEPSTLSSAIAPEITLAPNDGPPGASISITSTVGFSPTEPVALSFNGIDVGTISAAVDGTLAGTFTVPTTASGSGVITATGLQSDMAVSAPFTVTALQSTPASIPTSTPTSPPPPPPAATNTPTHTPVPPPPPPPPAATSTPVRSVPPVVPPVNPQRPAPAPAPTETTAGLLPLALSLSPGRVVSGQTLTVRVRTAAHAPVTVELRVTAKKVVVTGKGRHRKHVTRTVVLYEVSRHGRADAHGRFTARLHITYNPKKAVQAAIAVSARTPAGVQTRAGRVTIEPFRTLPLTIHLSAHSLAFGTTLTVGTRSTRHARVTITLQVVVSKVVVSGHGKHRKRVTRLVVLYRVTGTGVTDAHGRFTGRLRVRYHTSHPAQATLGVTVRLPNGMGTRSAKVTLRPAHH